MQISAFAYLLKALREEKELSLRDLAQLSDVDHAYIYRLESGLKDAPSEDVLAKIIKGLKVRGRDKDMLNYVVAHPEVDQKLVSFVRNDPSVSYQVFAAMASAAFRGPARPDYEKLLARVRQILSDEDDGG